MKTLSVSEAKSQLGRLVDNVLEGDETVFIRRGRRVVQIVPAAMSEPIPVFPMGSLSRTASDFAVSEAAASADAPTPRDRTVFARVRSPRARISPADGDTAKDLIDAGRRI